MEIGRSWSSVANICHLRGHGQYLNLPQPSQKCRLPLPEVLCENFDAIRQFPPNSWNLCNSLNPSNIMILLTSQPWLHNGINNTGAQVPFPAVWVSLVWLGQAPWEIPAHGQGGEASCPGEGFWAWSPHLGCSFLGPAWVLCSSDLCPTWTAEGGTHSCAFPVSQPSLPCDSGSYITLITFQNVLFLLSITQNSQACDFHNPQIRSSRIVMWKRCGKPYLIIQRKVTLSRMSQSSASSWERCSHGGILGAQLRCYLKM